MGEIVDMNRKQRRAEAKKPKFPNVTGNNESCANCAAALPRESYNKTVEAMAVWELKNGRPAPQPLAADDLICAHNPGGGVSMKTFGWCAQWRERK